MTTLSKVGIVAFIVVASSGAGRAEAQSAVPDAELRTDGANATVTAAPAGAFLPFTQAASVTGRRASAAGLAGYDTASKTSLFEALTEVRLWGPVSVRGGAVYSGADDRLRPTFGARVQFLSQESRAVDGALGVFYRPEGLTEPEGEIEGVLSFGRSVGGNYLVGNVLYGQDPEGRERDGEIRLAALRRFQERLVVAVDSRFRFDLGSDPAKLAAHHEATMDALVGPSVTAVLGAVALSLQAGGSARRLQGDTAYGLFFLGGVGTAF